MPSTGRTIYLDHAATSWPKPEAVEARLASFLSRPVGNVGRSAHRASLRSAEVVLEAREALAELLGAPDARDLVFTRGATEALNLVLKGFLRRGDLVAVSPMEHNSVLRPLNRLRHERGVRVATLPADAAGRIDLEGARRTAASPPPRLVAVAHAANVNGAVQDLAGLREVFGQSALLIDAAQSGGVLPIDVAAGRIDFLACSAHKGLLGPTGVGAAYLSPDHEVMPLMEGGTGSRSDEAIQPTFRPDRYEAGTVNVHGIAALAGALEHIRRAGLLGDLKRRLTGLLIEGLRDVPGLAIQSPADGTALACSFTLAGVRPDQVALRLEEEFGILCRPGLHCAPEAHRHLGTFPQGTVRLSPGYGNTDDDARAAVEAVEAIAAATRR